MSSTYLKLISVKPDFVPNKFTEDQAHEFLNELFKNHEVEIVKTDNIEFVDQGANFESFHVICVGEISK